MTLIEKCLVAWIACVIGAVMLMSTRAFGADVETSTTTETLTFAVKQISDGELTGVVAGLVLVAGAVARNAAVRAAILPLVEWLASRWTHKRRVAHKAKRRKRKDDDER